MNTPPSACPAAHSMDTEWFALDAKGRLGVFHSGEGGAVPVRANFDTEEPMLGRLAAALISARGQPKWRKRADALDDDALLPIATSPGFAARAKELGLVCYSKGPPAVWGGYALMGEDLEEWLDDGLVLGFLTRDDVIKWGGLSTYGHAEGIATGDYQRLAAPRSSGALPKEVKKRFGDLTLPVDFAKARSVELWRFMKEDDVIAWDRDASFDGSSPGDAESAAEPRRFELVAGSSSKFWEVKVDGPSLIVRFGRIGTGGQTLTRTLGHPADALAEAEKLIGEKTRKGYQPVTEVAAGEGARAAGGWQPSTLSPEAFAERFGVAPPPKKRVLLKTTEVLEEALIDFGQGEAGLEACSEAIAAAGLLYLDSTTLPEALDCDSEGLIDDSALAGCYGGLDSTRFAQTLGMKRYWLRLVHLSGKLKIGSLTRKLAEVTERRRHAEQLVAQALKAAGREKVTAIVADSGDHGDPALYVYTREAYARAAKKLASRSLMLRKSKAAREVGLLYAPVAAAKTIALMAPSGGKYSRWATGTIAAQAVFGVLQGRAEELKGLYGEDLYLGDGPSEDYDGATEAWNALRGLKPGEVFEVYREDRRELFGGELPSQAAALIGKEPARYAPLLVNALLAQPRDEDLERLTWILLERPVRQLSRDAAYVKGLKRLFAKTKVKRFAEALHHVGFPAPKADGLKVLNVADYV